jgi:hypothetical protein
MIILAVMSPGTTYRAQEVWLEQERLAEESRSRIEGVDVSDGPNEGVGSS